MKKSPMVGHLILKTYSNFANAKEEKENTIYLHHLLLHFTIWKVSWHNHKIHPFQSSI